MKTENTQRILEELIDYVSKMRENGEHDLRSVLFMLKQYKEDETFVHETEDEE